MLRGIIFLSAMSAPSIAMIYLVTKSSFMYRHLGYIAELVPLVGESTHEQAAVKVERPCGEVLRV